MCMCNKCGSCMGWTVLVAGILFLLKDLNVWNFFGIQPWTIVFILIAMIMIGKSCCKNCCNGACDMNSSAKKPTTKKSKK
jgi:hypothetical protein